MREMPITTRTAQTEDGHTLTLKYVMLVEETPDGPENYGVKITEADSAASAAAPWRRCRPGADSPPSDRS